jgi:nickel-type superoxide dismutase maturation protease
MILLRRVTGESMLPTLRPGQLVVAVRRMRVRQGDVVMLRHDGLEKIKRVAEMMDGRLFVMGDNPSRSTDSRTFGWLDPAKIVARVVWPRKLARR